MKKQLLSTALLTLLCTYAQADAPPIDSTTQAIQAPAAPVAATPVPAAAAESSLTATPPKPLPAPQPLPIVNCEYPLPAVTAIDPAILLIWAQKAAVQSFTFNPVDMDAQVEKLKPCFTDQGWQGFRDALDKSGNLKAMKSEGLTVTSRVDGKPIVVSVKENQWKITLPMQVVYQKNDTEKLTQLLSLDLFISRKVSGDLGITQVVATLRNTAPVTGALTPVATLMI